MNNFLQAMNSLHAPGLILVVVLVILVSSKHNGWIGQFIDALNTMTTPWIAILVIVLGEIFEIQCKAHGIDAASANQIIGAGIGLLTGKALADRERQQQNPPQPVGPAPNQNADHPPQP